MDNQGSVQLIASILKENEDIGDGESNPLGDDNA